GFVRDVPGGYVDAEEFLVLDGWLELEGVRRVPGHLVHVPAGFVRSHVHTEQGCTALAWFGGPADFVSADRLPPCADGISAIAVAALAGDPAAGPSAVMSDGWATTRSIWQVIRQPASVPDSGGHSTGEAV